jgi:hypothetical protein
MTFAVFNRLHLSIATLLISGVAARRTTASRPLPGTCRASILTRLPKLWWMAAMLHAPATSRH